MCTNALSFIFSTVFAWIVASIGQGELDRSDAIAEGAIRNEAVELLEEGARTKTFPETIVVRVHANLWAADSDSSDDRLKEAWEFSTDEIHRIEWVSASDESNEIVCRRIESRPFNTDEFAVRLLDCKLHEIDPASTDGTPELFAETEFEFGHRSVEILVRGQPAIVVGESCAFAGMPATEARKFAVAYEKLASEARQAFKDEVTDNEQ